MGCCADLQMGGGLLTRPCNRQPDALFPGFICTAQRTSQPCRRCTSLRLSSGLFEPCTRHPPDCLPGLHRFAPVAGGQQTNNRHRIGWTQHCGTLLWIRSVRLGGH